MKPQTAPLVAGSVLSICDALLVMYVVVVKTGDLTCILLCSYGTRRRSVWQESREGRQEAEAEDTVCETAPRRQDVRISRPASRFALD